VITVSNEINDEIKPKEKIVLHAFVPPIIENEIPLPENIIELLENNINNKIIIANAFKLVLHKNEDLYGLDLLIDVARMIKKDNKNYKIIFVVASTNDKLKFYEKMIKNENLESQISLIPHSLSFVKLMLKSDLVIRPTNTDGDALTIREAIFLNRPIIASDVVKRPSKTVLFKNRDSKDLYTKIKTLLDNENFNNHNFEDSKSNMKTYLKQYLSILES
jgi:glycosyltransferase involved in cell wall biosynthesis